MKSSVYSHRNRGEKTASGSKNEKINNFLGDIKMESALGIIIVAVLAVAVGVIFFRTWMVKRQKAKNPCIGCTYHECLMTHGVCDRLAKDSTNLK